MPRIKITEEAKKKITEYKQFMREREHSESTIIGYTRYLTRFLDLLSHGKNCSLEKSITDFLASEQSNSPQNHKNCRAALYVYYKMVEGKDIPKRQPDGRNSEIELILEQFYDYSKNIKGIQPNSADWEVSRTREFLEYVTRDKYHLPDDITAHDIRDYVVNRFPNLKDSSKGRVITAIRNFFRFQKFNGKPVHESIFMLPLSPAIWKKSAFPTTMDEQIFNRLSEIPDTGTLDMSERFNSESRRHFTVRAEKFYSSDGKINIDKRIKKWYTQDVFRLLAG